MESCVVTRFPELQNLACEYLICPCLRVYFSGTDSVSRAGFLLVTILFCFSTLRQAHLAFRQIISRRRMAQSSFLMLNKTLGRVSQ
jgi:hypothetical protein